MSHRHTVFEPAAGLTVLVGPNNCGKSAVVTALQILCHNDNSTYVLRHGAKECRIIVETDDGHRIEWTRKKSGSPSYKIDGKEFDRLRGESGVWDELKRTLRLPRVEFENNKFDVHIGEQRNPIFLLGDKGKGAAQFFASSSDASRLMEMQVLHKKQVAENKGEQKRLTQEKTRINDALECLEPVPELKKQLDRCEQQYQKLKADEIRTNRLEQLGEVLVQQQLDSNFCAAISKTLGNLPVPPQFHDPEPVKRLARELKKQQYAISRDQKSLDVYESLDAPPTFGDEEKLVQAIETLVLHQRAVSGLAATDSVLEELRQPPRHEDYEAISGFAKFMVELHAELETCSELRKELAAVNKKLDKAKSEITEWVEENPTCPTCGNDVTTEALIGKGGHQHG